MPRRNSNAGSNGTDGREPKSDHLYYVVLGPPYVLSPGGNHALTLRFQEQLAQAAIRMREASRGR